MRLAAARDGLPLEVLPRDSEGSPGSALRRLVELAGQERVLAVVGGWSAATGRPLAAAAAARGVPFIALSPVAVPDAGGVPGSFAMHRIAALGRAGARFARDDLGAARAGVAWRRGGEAHAALATSFADEFEAGGGEISWMLEEDAEGRLVLPVEAAPAAVVWVVGGGALAARVTELEAAARDAVLLAPEGFAREGLAALAASGRVVRVVGYFAPGDTAAATRELVAACEEAGLAPTAAHALGWDAMRAVRAAAREEGASREGLLRAFSGAFSLEGAAGRIAPGGGADAPAVSAVTSQGEHFLRRVPGEALVPPGGAPGAPERSRPGA
jgi:branched-chain amino acid transport system substrate-binding protein